MASPDPRTLRRLDRWAGMPLYFLAGLALLLAAPFRRRRDAAPGGRVLYVALAEMGSIVLAAPAIRRNARIHGTTPVFVTLAPTRPVFDFLGGEFAREVHVLRTGGIRAFCADLWRFARRMRRDGVTVAIDLDPGAHGSALVALLSGAPLRAGFAGAAAPRRGALYTHRVPCAEDRHMSENFAALMRAPFAPADGSVVAMPPPAGERLPRQPLVLLHANVSDPVPQRRWPQRRYLDLCRRLLAEAPDVRVLVVGAAEEAAAAADLCAEVGDARCASVAGAHSIAELPALFARAALLVSSDCGTAHFAAHAGLPVVALFGPETPRRYAPPGATTLYAGLPCSPCLSAHNQRASSCLEPRCMSAIAVDDVLAAVRSHLPAARRERTASA